jgi:hypothetical protein
MNDLDLLEEKIFKNIVAKCPSLAPEGKFAVRTGWIP